MKALFFSLVLILWALPVVAQQAEIYSCPMHPHITSDHAATCPICGMTLTALKKQPSKTRQGGTSLDAAALQRLNVQTTNAHQMPLGDEIHGYGKITENMANRYTLSTRTEGWVETMAIHGVGEKVTKGALLFTLYSPALLAAQKDYLSAVGVENAARKNATKQRLLALGMQEKAIAEMVKNKAAFEHVPFYAPMAGFVSSIHAHEGAAVQAGAPLMVLDDYSTLWVDVAVSATGINLLNMTSTATLSLPDTGQRTPATVELIHPTIAPLTRTGGVRLRVDNLEGLLKPEQYADVVFETNVQPRLVIPEQALLHAKDGFKVMLAMEGGHFTPQPVTVGVRSGGFVEVTSGLGEHDSVVTNGQFLIDADSNLKNASAHMSSREIKAGGAHAGH